MIDAQLTTNFWLREFLFSQTAANEGWELSPSAVQADNLQRLAETLELVRALWGFPVVITSGLRDLKLNQQIGGAPHSAHLQGRAADFNIAGLRPSEVFWGIFDRMKWLAVDQVILEHNRWIHLAVAGSESRPRREFLIAKWVDGKVKYERAA